MLWSGRGLLLLFPAIQPAPEPAPAFGNTRLHLINPVFSAIQQWIDRTFTQLHPHRASKEKPNDQNDKEEDVEPADDPDSDETFQDDETELTEVLNEGRKIVHNFSDHVAYQLNCYNDKATKWMVKQGKFFITCVDTLDDVLNVFEAQFA